MAVIPALDQQRSARLPMPSDEEARAIADDISQAHPHWLVIWGTYTRQFVAFALFPMRHRIILTARYPPSALDQSLDATERRCRTQPSKGSQR